MPLEGADFRQAHEVVLSRLGASAQQATTTAMIHETIQQSGINITLYTLRRESMIALNSTHTSLEDYTSIELSLELTTHKTSQSVVQRTRKLNSINTANTKVKQH